MKEDTVEEDSAEKDTEDVAKTAAGDNAMRGGMT